MSRLIRTADQTYRLDSELSETQFRMRRPWPELITGAAIATVCFVITSTMSRKPAPPIVVESPTAAAAITAVASLDVKKSEHISNTFERLSPTVVATTQVPMRTQSLASVTPASPPPRKQHEVRQAKATEAAVPENKPQEPEPSPVQVTDDVRVSASPWREAYSSKDLLEQLKRVPLIEFSILGSTDAAAKEVRRQKQTERRNLERTVREQRENFFERVVKVRPDMAGLPFRGEKECHLQLAVARDLESASRTVRTQMSAIIGRNERPTRTGTGAEVSAASMAFEVYHLLIKNPRLADPRNLPAVEQVLTGEAAPIRMGLVNFLRSPADSPSAATLLARRAVFDTSDEVRQAARDGLRLLSACDYLPTLLEGLRHPWPAANFHAAEALAELNTQTAIPELVRILDEPDPCAPFETQLDGKRVLAVRELVRLNHHASCLICHAPSLTATDAVRAPVPNLDQPLPTRQYYGDRLLASDDVIVRADITYLRQDFSEVLPVENPAPWPKMQRFDFVVRIRKVMEGEAAAILPPAGPTDIRQIGATRRATIFALQQLTGLDGGGTANSWTNALATKSWRKLSER